uniref:Uncharacterized protein n=1 Tax=Acrobeloides nanus TaxID=290746 RepID=A0A914DH27_9BILA
MQNFGFVTFGTAIGLDSEVSTMAFMRFGHKNYSLLTTPYETLPRSIWCFDKYEQHVKLSFDYRFRMETSKELFTKDMCESPIEFWPKIVDPPKEKKGQKRRKNDLLENEEKKPEQSFSSIVRNMPTPTEDDVAECFREV